jgi:hypothetical protein
MKPLTLALLGGSLLLNAVLAVVLLRPTDDAAPPSAAHDPAPVPANATAEAPLAGAWGRIETKEFPDLVARLRAEGFPPEIVRAILISQIGESFAARRQALEAGVNRPYWMDPGNRSAINLEWLKLSREQTALLRQLLGADAETSDPMRDLYQNRNFSFLTAEKAVDLRQLLREFDERRTELFASSPGMMTDRTKMAALEKEQQDAIAALLSPEEHFEYRLRNSNSASILRESLSAFNPTEEEYRTMFRLREAFDDKYRTFNQSGSLVLNEALMRERSAAEKQLNEQIKAALAPERAATYDRLTDYSFRRTNQLVERLGLPAATTDRLWETQKEFELRRNDIFRTATPDQRTQMLSSLQQEAVARVAALFGQPSHLEAYKQYGGNWLQSLNPPLRPPPR